MHRPRCFLQELPGHVHLCTGDSGEDSSRLRIFEGFKLVTNLKETMEAKCKYRHKLTTVYKRHALHVYISIRFHDGLLLLFCCFTSTVNI